MIRYAGVRGQETAGAGGTEKNLPRNYPWSPRPKIGAKKRGKGGDQALGRRDKRVGRRKRQGQRRKEREVDPDPNPRDEKTWLVDQSAEGRKFRYEDRSSLCSLCIFDTSPPCPLPPSADSFSLFASQPLSTRVRLYRDRSGAVTWKTSETYSYLGISNECEIDFQILCGEILGSEGFVLGVNCRMGNCSEMSIFIAILASSEECL